MAAHGGQCWKLSAPGPGSTGVMSMSVSPTFSASLGSRRLPLTNPPSGWGGGSLAADQQVETAQAGHRLSASHGLQEQKALSGQGTGEDDAVQIEAPHVLVEHNLGRALQCRHRVPDDDIDEATAEAAISLLTPDAPAGVSVEPITVTAERYGSVPHSYVVCARDNAIRPELQRLFVKETDAVSA